MPNFRLGLIIIGGPNPVKPSPVFGASKRGPNRGHCDPVRINRARLSRYRF